MVAWKQFHAAFNGANRRTHLQTCPPFCFIIKGNDERAAVAIARLSFCLQRRNSQAGAIAVHVSLICTHDSAKVRDFPLRAISIQ